MLAAELVTTNLTVPQVHPQKTLGFRKMAPEVSGFPNRHRDCTFPGSHTLVHNSIGFDESVTTPILTFPLDGEGTGSLPLKGES